MKEIFNNKKGTALIFLLELLFLASLIIIISAVSYKTLSADSKYYEYDSKNLALFLERIPSVEGNFEYEFKFKNSVDVGIYENKVVLTKNGKLTNKNKGIAKISSYETDYLNPILFKFDYEFFNVNSIYFYKSGDDVIISKEKLDFFNIYKLSQHTFSNLDNNFSLKKVYFALEGEDISTKNYFEQESNFEFDFSKNYLNGLESEELLFSYVVDEMVDSKEIVIIYNSKGKVVAGSFFNSLTDKLIIDGEISSADLNIRHNYINNYQDLDFLLETSNENFEELNLEEVPLIVIKVGDLNSKIKARLLLSLKEFFSESISK